MASHQISFEHSYIADDEWILVAGGMSQITPSICEQLSGIQILCILYDGEPWFKAIDIATALKYRNTDDAVRRHVADDDQRKQGSFNLDTKATGLKGNWRSVIYTTKSGVRTL